MGSTLFFFFGHILKREEYSYTHSAMEIQPQTISLYVNSSATELIPIDWVKKFCERIGPSILHASHVYIVSSFFMIFE